MRGKRQTLDEHLPEHRRDLRHRSRSYWIERAEAMGPEVLRFGQFHDLDVRAGREVQKDWYRFAIGFGYPFRCDLFPNSDFDLFGVVGWSCRDPRRELAEPRNALVRGADGRDDSRRFEAEQYAGHDWSVRIAIFELSHGPEVRLQESVDARTTASLHRVTRS